MKGGAGEIAVLIATKNRFARLRTHALRSIQRQNLAPSLLVIVNDGETFDRARTADLMSDVGCLSCTIVPNSRSPGAAGAWNSGLTWLVGRGFDGFVAILDDDDEWDHDHLQQNLDAARSADANVAISGLRHYLDGHEIPRPLIESVAAGEFLFGNPGWQGTNTFLTLRVLQEVGGFRDGLQSLNDRDLAFRILCSPSVRVAYTRRWTATWYGRSIGTLSSRRSPQKFSGLRWFWHLYGSKMSESDEAAFFDRAERFFGIERCEILNATTDLPPHANLRGDLDG